jgi:predicted ribonuclease YlaK
MNKNILVLDTSSIINHPNLFLLLEDTSFIIPIEVLEELDNAKVKNDASGFNARKANRAIDEIRAGRSLTDGVTFGKGNFLKVSMESDLSLVPAVFSQNVDSKIISVAKKYWEESLYVKLVSADISLRLKANSIGVDSVSDDELLFGKEDLLYSGCKVINTEPENITDFYRDGYVSHTRVDLYPNQAVILKSGDSSSAIGVVKGSRVVRLRADKKDSSIMGMSPKNKEQRFAMEYLLDQDIPMVSIAGVAGTGKAQPLYSKILTPNGWITMGDVEVGNHVIGRDGKKTIVTSIHPQGEKEIFRVIFSDGTFTDCCDEHLWHTKTQLDRDKKRPGSVKSLSEIKRTLRTGSLQKRNHSIPMVEAVEFEKIDVPLDPYMLGLLLGDGVLAKTELGFCSADEEIVADICRISKSYGCEVVSSDEDINYRINQNGSKKILNAIKSLDLLDKKSHNKFIPSEYLFNSIDVRTSILRGLMDTDGFVSKNGTSVVYYSVSDKLADGVKFIVESLGGKAVITTKSPKYKYNGEIKNGRLCFCVHISLPPEINPFKLTRKANLVRPKSKYKPTRYIDRVEYVGKIEAKCISVDNPEHLYVTDNFIVTHNTMFAAVAAMHMLDKGLYEKLVICRPAVSVSAGIGFLPGTKLEKLQPWIQPIFDNLKHIMKCSDMYLNLLIEKGKIEVESLSYIRGRTFPNTIMIIDEAQNSTPSEMKAVITRMGEKSKLIITGDLEQIDSPKLDIYSSGLSTVVNKFKQSELSAHITLQKTERSELAALAAKLL